MLFLFQSLDARAQQYLQPYITFLPIKKNTRFATNMQYPGHLVFSTIGAFAIIKSSLKGREKILYILGADEMLSTFPLSTSEHTEYCKALIDGEIVLIEQTAFRNFLLDFPLAALNLITYQEKVQSRLKRQIKNFNLPIKDRLLARLWKLAYDFGTTSKDSWLTIQIPLSMQTLADFIGSNRETISRLMHELEDEGYLLIQQKYISIHLAHASAYLKTIK